MHEVLVDTTPAAATAALVHDGAPVWPVGPAAATAMGVACEQLGVRMRSVVAMASTSSASDGELVVGFGAESAPAARLYAHLTGRRHGQRERADWLRPGAWPAVLVLLEAELDCALLDELAGLARRGVVIGIITAHDATALESQVLVRALYACYSARSAPAQRRVDMLPGRPGRASGSAHLVVGRGATTAEIEHGVELGAGVLALHSHSDGVDTSVGAMVLCGGDRATGEIDPARSPRCRITGMCHRAGTSVADWQHNPARLAPERLAARAFVYGVCWGAMLPGAWDDPAFSVGRRLLGSARIGALITTWEALPVPVRDVEALARRIAEGATVGAALHAVMASTSAIDNQLRLCLFGDPRLAIPAPIDGAADAVEPVAPARVRVPVPVPVPPPSGLGELGLLRHYLDLVRRSSRSTADTGPALASVATVEHALALGAAVPAEDSSTMRCRFLAVWAQQGPMPMHDWHRLAHKQHGIEDAGACCAACGEPVRVWRYPLRLPGAAARDVRFCVRCGLVADGPAGNRMALIVDDGHAVATSVPSTTDWDGRLVCFTKGDGQAPLVVDWPRRADGRPAGCCPLPALAPGVYEVVLAIIDGTTWRLATALVRRPPFRGNDT